MFLGKGGVGKSTVTVQLALAAVQVDRDKFHCIAANHGLINYIDTKAVCRFPNKLTRTGTSRRCLFIRVYTLVIQSIVLVFSTQLCELLPLYFSLWSGPPPPFPVRISIQGGSDISGTLSKLHCCIKKIILSKFFCHKPSQLSAEE
jgi:hypothetical protein